MHVPREGAGYGVGAGGSFGVAEAGVAVSEECRGDAGAAGYRICGAEGCGVFGRGFLARVSVRRMEGENPGVLAEEDRRNTHAGSAEFREIEADGVEGVAILGA